METGAGTATVDPLGAAPDLVQPFRIERFALRGRLVRLAAAAEDILGRHDYPDDVATLLGETVALASLLAAALKFEGVFNLQTRGDGPVSLMVADVTSDGGVRGYAQYDAARLAAPGPGRGSPVPRLLGAGYLAFTVDQGPDTERYQGIVELAGATVADCAHHYFRQSEQLEAGIRLAAGRGPAGDWRAAGLMIQRVPEQGGRGGELESEAVEDGWRRALLLMGSARPEELLDPDLPPNRLLYRLFHEDGVRVFRPRPLASRCRCSHARVERMLAAMPRREVETLREDGLVTVTCQFCNRRYRFDDAALARLYRAG